MINYPHPMKGVPSMVDGVRASTGGTVLSWLFPVPTRPDVRIVVATQTELTAFRARPVARRPLPHGQLRPAARSPAPLLRLSTSRANEHAPTRQEHASD
jgi:hypothetical protein